jgi:uncharacterized RDD family membrane protein YckC
MSTDVGVRYAGFWIRLAAFLLDIILLMAITGPLLFLIYGLAYFDPEGGSGPRGPLDILISYVLPAVAAIVFWKYKSATPGKMVLSIRIIDARTGGKLSTAQCIVRYFAYLVSTIPLGLGFLWIAFDRRKQAWHDKLAGTVVMRGN